MASRPGSAAVFRQLGDEGFSVARAVVTGAQLDALRSETHALIRGFAMGHRSPDFWCYTDASTGKPVLYRVHNLEAQAAPGCAALFHSGVLHLLAAELLGAVDATVCALIVKTPGVAEVPWHRDRTDVPPGSVINLSLYLDDSTADNGCLEVVPRSHRFPDDADVEATRRAGPRVSVPAGAGDVAIHDVRLMHGSGPNLNGALRRSIIVEFAEASGLEGRRDA
jgi:phytanoyl-CoA hydroxylase